MQFQFKKLSGFETLDKLITVLQDSLKNQTIQSFNLSSSIRDNHVQFNQSTVNELRNNPAIQQLLQVLKDRPFIRCRTIRVNIRQNPNLDIQYDDQPGVLSQIVFNDNQHPSTAEEAIRIADSLHHHLNLLVPEQMNEIFLGTEQNEAVRHHEACLSDLTAAVSKLGNHLTAQSDKLNEFLMAKTAELEKRYQEKEAALEAENKKRLDAIAQKEKAFEAEKAKFDARDRTVVRRDILNKMQAYLKERSGVKLSDTTNRKRYFIHGLFILFLLLSGTFVGTFASKVFQSQAADWHQLAPLSAGTIVFVTTMLYYIRWNDQWVKEHSRAEFYNMKFESDILRASWIAELFFEGQEDGKKVDMPPALMTTLSQNLFQDLSAPVQNLHPIEQVLAAFNNASEVEVGKDGMKIKK